MIITKLLNQLILLLDGEFLFLLTITFSWFSLFEALDFKAPTFLATFISSTIKFILVFSSISFIAGISIFALMFPYLL